MAPTEPSPGQTPPPEAPQAAADGQTTKGATAAESPTPGSPESPAAGSKGDTRGVKLTYITPALSLVLGALVLVPAATGQLQRPFIWELLLPAFVFLAILSAVLLIAAVPLGAFPSKTAGDASHVARGFGSGFASCSAMLRCRATIRLRISFP